MNRLIIFIVSGMLLLASGARAEDKYSLYGGWVNPFEPINKGRLGSTQEWRKEKPKKHYY